MATKKKLLQAAAGTAAASGGAGGLNVEQVFSTYLYDGNGSSQVIENGINLGQSNSGGGAYFTGADTNCVIVPPSSDFGFGTGDYTIEFFVFKTSDKNYNTYYDQRTSTQNATTASPFIYSDSGGTLYFYVEGTNRIIGSGTNVATGAWTHVAVCRSSGSTRMFVNGTQIGSTFSDSINYVTPANNFSFGGSEEQSLYNVEGYMSNVRVVKGSALYTSNFTAPTSALTAVSGTVLLALQGDDPFTDNSSSGHALVNDNAKASSFGPFDAADAGEGGLVWIKERDAISIPVIYDTERGVGKLLRTNDTNAETDLSASSLGITAYNSNGFSLGGTTNNDNDSGINHASWTFRKAPKFFDVVTYTGNGTAGRTVSHDLGTTVGSIFVKRTDSAANWMVYHRGNTSAPHTDFLKLNLTDATQDAVSIWNDTAPTSTEFTVGSSNDVNANGGTYVAYLFAHNDGDGDFGPTGDQDIIKCGSYTGNNGQSHHVELGFEPQWLLVKNADLGTSGAWWSVVDVMRGVADNDIEVLKANTSDAEINENGFTPTATGFTVANNNDFQNNLTNNYIYIAIRRGPMAVPESATDVFAIDTENSTGDGNLPQYRSGFPVDMALEFERDGGLSTRPLTTGRLIQGKYLVTSSTAAEGSWGNTQFDFMNGWLQDGDFTADTTRISHMWKRAPNYFDVVAYTGNGTAGHTVSHNLGVAPEMIWVKRRDTAASWPVYHSALGNSKYLTLNDTDAASGSSTAFWNSTSPTATEFTVDGNTRANASGGTYIAYLFASLDGVSKVGSYTGNGSTQNIDCGFSSGARFVLIKCSSHSLTDWHVMDSTRGIVAGNDPFLYLNSNSAEDTGEDIIDPYSSGFALPANNRVNTSGRTYIFYAIA